MRTCLNLFVLLAAAGAAIPCHAGTSSVQSQPDDVTHLRQIVERQGRQLMEQQRQIDELQTRVGVSDNALNIRGGQGEPGQSRNQAPAAETSSKEKKAGSKQAAQAQEQLPTQPVGRPPVKPPVRKQYEEIEAIFRQQGVLTPKGTLVFEPSFQYAYSSSTRVVLSGYTIIPAIVIGLIDVRSVNRNTYIPAFTARYGLTRRLEFNAYVPYVFRSDSAAISSTLSAPATQDRVFNASGNNIGDVQFGLRYQINMPTSGGPIFIAGLTAKSNTGKGPFNVPVDSNTGLETELATGTGFWGIQPSLSAIFPTDPVVFFGSVNYLYSFSSNESVPTTTDGTTITTTNAKVEPGGIFGFNFGLGFSMNEKTSFSVGYEQYIVGRTKVNNTIPAGSQTSILGSLLFGASYKLSDRTSINFSLEAGITEAAPDVVLTMRVPFSI
ncbi:MAG: transporter [Geobacteraceae bacterium]|nr:transporter [Geobacteraceae bacterium]